MNCKLWIVNCKQITVLYSARIMNSELWTLIQLHSATITGTDVAGSANILKSLTLAVSQMTRIIHSIFIPRKQNPIGQTKFCCNKMQNAKSYYIDRFLQDFGGMVNSISRTYSHAKEANIVIGHMLISSTQTDRKCLSDFDHGHWF